MWITSVSSFHSPSVKQQSNLPGISQDFKREPSSTPPAEECSVLSTARGFSLTSSDEPPECSASCSDGSKPIDHPNDEGRDNGSTASSSGSPWFLLRKDATLIISHTLQRGRKNLWQLMTSRIAVLLSSSAVTSSSIHQFLRNYEDLSIFILAGEAFCGIEAVEFRQKLKSICEGYFVAFHRQNIYALKMVMEKENWQIMPPETIQVVSFAGLVGDGAALIISPDSSPSARLLHANRSAGSANVNSLESSDSFQLNGVPTHGESGNVNGKLRHIKVSPESGDANHINGSPASEDENDDLHADFIDEDSQLPSRISRPNRSRHQLSDGNDENSIAQTGSSLTLLRLMDKYARLMQKLEIINVEFFKGICQLFGIFFQFVFETFCQLGIPPGGKGFNHLLPHKLKTALSKFTQDYDQWVKPQSSQISSPSPTSLSSLSHRDITPTSPPAHLNSSTSLKERCAGADTLSLVAKLLHRSKAHLQSRLLQSNGAVVEDFYVHLVDAVPELTQQIHRTTARLLLHVDGYVDRIANAKWEVKELGLEHNGYVDLLLGEFKHYKTRVAHGGIRMEVQDLLLEYGLENIAETLIEGLSRVKRCTDEGRALMSLDLQVLINGLKHFVSIEVGPKLQVVETFIKAFYLPETEYVHWSRAHPEYSKTQIIGLVNLVATMKGWKRKTRLEVLEKIE
ncbi:coiled-coil domain-containing protein 132 [Dorcoceras hygrometricum]|uniref:Coiled-coil domain-containing protein 132 n=1 Tax=Dorcoceras hygrometricum TaxID=472368 RepID=A0A2Z7CJS5_9LAMI|nr:coiled-coil domain-containing protein 132 [Dorcoceras hygrometricum]